MVNHRIAHNIRFGCLVWDPEIFLREVWDILPNVLLVEENGLCTSGHALNSFLNDFVKMYCDYTDYTKKKASKRTEFRLRHIVHESAFAKIPR